MYKREQYDLAFFLSWRSGQGCELWNRGIGPVVGSNPGHDKFGNSAAQLVL